MTDISPSTGCGASPRSQPGRIVTSETIEIMVGDRVLHRRGRTPGVVIGLVKRREALALVAFEGQLPREVPVGALEPIR